MLDVFSCSLEKRAILDNKSESGTTVRRVPENCHRQYADQTVIGPRSRPIPWWPVPPAPGHKCKVGFVEWKRGTGSEHEQMPNPPEISPARCLSPFSTVPPPPRHPSVASRKRGQAPSAQCITTAIPIVDGASPHFRAPV